MFWFSLRYVTLLTRRVRMRRRRSSGLLRRAALSSGPASLRPPHGVELGLLVGLLGDLGDLAA
jgi:hypothetical protein